MRRRLYPGGHPEVTASLNALSAVYADLARPAEAEAAMREALEMGRRLWPEGHPRLVRYHENLAGLLRTAGKLDEARRIAADGAALAAKLLPPEHPHRKSIDAMAAELAASR
jgi:hypothetical protein